MRTFSECCGNANFDFGESECESEEREVEDDEDDENDEDEFRICDLDETNVVAVVDDKVGEDDEASVAFVK